MVDNLAPEHTLPGLLNPGNIAHKMAAAHKNIRKHGMDEDVILIPRKGGLFNGKPFKCFRSVYNTLCEGQLFTAYAQLKVTFFEAHVMQYNYRLQKDSAGDWELVYIEPGNV